MVGERSEDSGDASGWAIGISLVLVTIIYEYIIYECCYIVVGIVTQVISVDAYFSLFVVKSREVRHMLISVCTP